MDFYRSKLGNIQVQQHSTAFNAELPRQRINALPAEQPTSMPEQTLSGTGAPQQEHRVSRREPRRVHALRWAIGLGVVGTVALGVSVLLRQLSPGGLDGIETALLLFYGTLLLWLSANFWVCVAGILVRVGRRWRPQTSISTSPNRVATTTRFPRTAVLMPLHNENAADAFARVAVMMRSLEAVGGADGFQFFVLSDSTDPRRCLEEERLWLDSRCRLNARKRLFYRRRPSNEGRKPGNIAEFCRRWGQRYDYMVVLDADSLMTGKTLVECVRRMEADPNLGLLQTWPRPIGGATLFARAQQFAAAVSGPLIVAGMAALAGRVGNYWGHNAVIRTRAFIESCGLPQLSGRPPLGGNILSHDFVEAALLVRQGWDVRLDANLGGSYEEGPPNLLESLRRDRRWCQGNLQHLRVLPARGLHPISRINLLIGLMSFLAGPVWLIFVGLALTETLRSSFAERLSELSLSMSPNLGAVGAQQLTRLLQDDGALTLLGLSAALLLGPKAMGLSVTLLDPQKRRAHGGALRVAVSGLLETGLSALIAPIMMLAHSRFVGAILIGRSVGWTAPQRDVANVGWTEAVHPLAWIALTAALLTAVATGAVPEAFFWLSPILLSAALAIPLAVLTGRRRIGMTLARLGLLRIPEETEPPAVIQAHTRWPRRRDAQIRDQRDLAAALRRPLWLRLHAALTPRPDGSLAHAQRLAAVLQRVRRDGLDHLSLDDWQVLLARPDVLAELVREPKGRPDHATA